MSISTGDKAPDFKLTTLTADGPVHITLSENFGKTHTLLLFVPMAFTGVCTEELCGVTNSLNDYSDLGATVIGISGDNPFAQAAWAEKEGIKLPLASDYEHKVAEAYGVAYDSFVPEKNLDMGGVANRSAFLVDKKGIVQYAEVKESPLDLPDFEAIKTALRALG